MQVGHSTKIHSENPQKCLPRGTRKGPSKIVPRIHSRLERKRIAESNPQLTGRLQRDNVNLN